MGTAQVQFTEEELLADVNVAEPLVAGGVRCHGGFDEDGSYVSPRTRFRVPAIEAWGAQNCERFSSELIDVPTGAVGALVPERRAGALPDPRRCPGTAHGDADADRHRRGIRSEHPSPQPETFSGTSSRTWAGRRSTISAAGLFEAHGRDEAGWDEEAGHRDMWFAARDIAFDRSCQELDVEAMLDRMGFGPGRPGADAARAAPRRHPARARDDGLLDGPGPLH